MRVVRADGKIMIVMPDLDVAEAKYPELVESVRYGADRWGGDQHLWESRPATCAQLLVEAGAPEARLIPITSLIGSEWPVTAFVDWQYAFEI
jgi:hypothetical protein